MGSEGNGRIKVAVLHAYEAVPLGVCAQLQGSPDLRFVYKGARLAELEEALARKAGLVVVAYKWGIIG